ncbi:hypothetical protein A3C87_02290 [Candidatus Kaiserbacteria bacterium RIFCSPHIGHO2_02_FULL_49_34]|uniref:Phospho-N-acetylmuramoyl-pentapeptide-transferase n=1 Tax=Candidatus Kaiserbacteria bacterium RIFCSPHIGHO2_02_FULL_49_34 TaxID=1798491 RepID=A0A1F6DLY0_9BACT|nr:MAG: hypothetical protein A3C87_02290 [Candidatus Kaiserbacteria bacterium RIFCSPHIGHO2_02_FULL_49_34]
MHYAIIKILAISALTFTAAMAVTPFVTHFLYKHKMWKKKAGKGGGYGGGGTPLFNELHKDADTGTPRMGGAVIWLGLLIALGAIVLGQFLAPQSLLADLNFISRAQTWIPMTAFIVGALVGFIDDYSIVKGSGTHFADAGLSLRLRLGIVLTLAAGIGWWFYAKLGVSAISFFGITTIPLGVGFILFFMAVVAAVYASGVIDGIDGLSGGVFLFIFAAYTGVALIQGQTDIAMFCAAIVGGLLAFLWFNIPPARFYMTETGIMALTLALATVAFLTDNLVGGVGVSLLPIIGGLLVITVASNIIQVLSKKLRNGKKVFLIAPLHHHFEALGWPRPKIVMRYWIVGFVLASLGILVALLV